MKKLTVEQRVAREALVDLIERETKDLEDAADTLTEAVREYNASVRAFNAHLEGVREFVGDVCAAMDTYIDDKSEAWQETDAGEAYMDWKSLWEDIDLSDVDAYDMEQIELPSGLHTELSELPDSPG